MTTDIIPAAIAARRRIMLRWLPLLLVMVSCNFDGARKLNRRVTLWRKDKIPYGTYIAYENLSHLFPDAEITINKASPSSWSYSVNKKAYIIISSRMQPDDAEINAITNFVSQGNHVFISAFYIGDSLLRSLNLSTDWNHGTSPLHDSLRVSVYHPETGDSLSYVYPGFSYDNWLNRVDSQYATVLGRDEGGRPNLVRYTYKGGGTLMLQFAPMAFTNFFLLHKHNMSYYDNVLSYIPGNVKEVMWDDYFRYSRAKNDFSALGYIFRNRALRWAAILLLLLFLLVYLFESKRKQRIVPVIAPLRNNSLDFVKTIGRLYYQRRDNQNLVVKMVSHFQDHIRNRYNMAADLSDEGFADRLAYKTGMEKGFLLGLMQEMQLLHDSKSVSDEDLLAFNGRLEEFYKHA